MTMKMRKRKSKNALVQELKQRIYEDERVVGALLDSREILVCEDTGALIIGQPTALVDIPKEDVLNGFRILQFPGRRRCDAVFDLHTPISEVKNPQLLRRVLQALEQYTED